MKATSKGRIKIILKGSALVLWCVVIFMFSANNADESNKQSNAVFNTVIEFVNPVYDSLDTTAQAEYKDTATFIIRKLAHFSEYALLGILAFINFSKVKKLGYRGLFAAVFSCIYASSDEIHQLFVPGRAGQVRDVLIDTSGAVAGILLAILIRKIWLKSREKKSCARNAIQTHFVQIGENYIDLVKRYVAPLYQEGDILSISEKIVALCQKRVVYKKDMRLSWLARFLSKFAMHSEAGIGVDSPWKMQFAIDHCGALKVIWAAICAGVGKLFGKHGIFYDMVGQEITGLDGFYDHVFDVYGQFGIRIPENSSGVCDEIYAATGVKAMIVDANDLTRDLLGKAQALEEPEADLLGMIRDNPAGQSAQCTPFILIRPIAAEEVDACEAARVQTVELDPKTVTTAGGEA